MLIPLWVRVTVGSFVAALLAALTYTTIGSAIAFAYGLYGSWLLVRKARASTGPTGGPWRKLSVVAILAFVGIGARLIHGAMIGEDYPLPSPFADFTIVVLYVVMIMAQYDFVRLRTAGRDLDAWLDALVAGGATAVVLWVGVMHDYVTNAEVDAGERVANVVFFALSIALVTMMFRVMAAPGVRSPAYYLLGGAALSLLATDLGGTIAYAQESDPSILIAFVPLVFGFAGAAGYHPDSAALTARPSDVEPRMRFWRAAVVAAGLALPWLILASNFDSLAASELAVLIATGPIFVTLILWRILRLIQAREMLLRQAESLRDAGDRLLSSNVDPAEIFEIVGNAVEDVVFADIQWLGLVANGECLVGDLPADVVDLVTPALGGEVRMEVTANGRRANLFAVPVPWADGRLAWIVTGTKIQLQRHDRQALRALAREASMALHGAERAAAVAEAEAERRWTRAIVESERRQRALLLHSSDIVAVLSDDWTISYVSPPVESVLDYRPEDLVGSSARNLFAPESMPLIEDLVAMAMATGSSSGEVALIHRSGEFRTLQLVLGDHRGADDINGIIINARDVSKTRALEEQLERDPVTGALNREAFVERMQRQLLHQPSATGLRALVVLQVADLDLVTSAVGYESSDTLLVEVSDRLRSNLRIGDDVARLDGSTFAVLLDRILSSSDLLELTGRIADDVARPLQIADGSVDLQVHSGAVLCTDGAAATELLANGLIAKETAVANSSRVELYEDGIAESYQLQLELRSRMRSALADGEFSLHYQPIIDLERQRVAGAEALARWAHPTRGPVGPNIFIAEAERGGLIEELGQWVIETSAAQLGRWIQDDLIDDDFTLSVNVSARQLTTDLPGIFETALSRFGVPAEKIRIELTESLFATNSETAIDVLSELALRGHTVAIDDFGTGTSNLARLGQYDIHVVKLDRSLIAPLDQPDARATGLVARTLELIEEIGAIAVAEGIETGSQALLLRELGCPLAQGFFFGRPAPADQFRDDFLVDGRVRTVEESTAGTTL
ncbi:MAG: PAS domain S-box-containing protein [Candidatus Aldehydirespiratoraceae bacterium]